MALSPVPQLTFDDDTDEELTDEQIQQLLQEAAERLRAKEAAGEARASKQSFKLPKLHAGTIADTATKFENGVQRLDTAKLIDPKQRILANGVKKIDDPLTVKKQKIEEKKATAGANWFNLPRTDLTPELRRDLQLLKMRNVLDPKRHYKKSDAKSDVPEYSQVGTVIEGPTEYYNGRINKKDRKQTFVEEVLAQEESSGKFKRKYDGILKSKSSGKKAFYKALKEQRRNGKGVKI